MCFANRDAVLCFSQVSRCGMIYMEPSSLGWRPLVVSWLHEMPATLTDTHKSIVNELFERFVDSCLLLVRKGGIKVGSLYIYVCVCVCVYVCMYICVYVCMYVYIYIYICMYVCIDV